MSASNLSLRDVPLNQAGWSQIEVAADSVVYPCVLKLASWVWKDVVMNSGNRRMARSIYEL